uniref:Ras and Rab interactor 3 n=1 Tax=Bubo bubo TaxID=30461 RepID=A0A8C0I853_BUBBB
MSSHQWLPGCRAGGASTSASTRPAPAQTYKWRQGAHGVIFKVICLSLPFCRLPKMGAEGDSQNMRAADSVSGYYTNEEGKKTHLCQATDLQNCLLLPGISILDKLIKTCPVWLQLNMNQERAGAILSKETAGIFLVRKEGNVKNMVLAVRLPVQNEAPGVVEYNIKEEKSKVIAETALYKCVLKPLKEAIDSYLKEIHNKDRSLQQLKENQLVIQNTTTTDLGITTSVPETVVLEKILHKFTTMHKAYSPEKKIAILLKSCKLIYDSMAQGNPGKPYGADDFLPVLMYVLARSNLTEVLLNVEYMMELMDPALQLGEGSYYLTTTYGALEHIKNYDKITITRQLSMEVQDSIHRWERRRTLNKARIYPHGSLQDFISISFLEIGAQSRTLASRNDTTAEQLSQQCAEKFEVSHPKDYGLFVYVDDQWLQLDKDALPHHIKASLLKSETKKDFYFIYKPIDHKTPPSPLCTRPVKGLHTPQSVWR